MAKRRKSKSAEVATISPDRDREWEARSAFDTISRAYEHMADKDLMKRVRAHAKKESSRAARVARLEDKDI